MRTSATATSWSIGQFGPFAGEVARRVVQACTDAQRVGTRTQRASGQVRRYAFGSTWTSKYEQMVQQFTVAAGGELPPVETVAVARAPYELVRVNGRLLIPFVLARTVSEVPNEPTLASEVLRAITAKTVPPPPPPLTLFDEDAEIDLRHQVPMARAADEAGVPVPAAQKSDPAPVFVGYVANADSESLLAVFWGTAKSVDVDTGTISWSPEQLPVHLATVAAGLDAVPAPRESEGARAFDEGTPPEVAVVARPRRIERTDEAPDEPARAPEVVSGRTDA